MFGYKQPLPRWVKIAYDSRKNVIIARRFEWGIIEDHPAQVDFETKDRAQYRKSVRIYCNKFKMKHFLEITRSYGDGIVCRSDILEVPINNLREHLNDIKTR